MNQENFEAQCRDDLNRLIEKFGEEINKAKITEIYNGIKNKAIEAAKITDYLSILIEKETEAEIKNLLKKNKILDGSLA